MGFFKNIHCDPREHIISMFMDNNSVDISGIAGEPEARRMQRMGDYAYIDVGRSRITGESRYLVFDLDEVCNAILNFQKGTPSPINISYIKKINLIFFAQGASVTKMLIYEKDGPDKHIGGPLVFYIKQSLWSQDMLLYHGTAKNFSKISKEK